MDISAAHVRRLELWWTFDGDSEVLRTCLSIVSSYSSLEELEVGCNTPGEHSLVAESPCSAYCCFTPVGIIVFEWLARQFCFVISTERKECTTVYSFLFSPNLMFRKSGRMPFNKNQIFNFTFYATVIPVLLQG